MLDEQEAARELVPKQRAVQIHGICLERFEAALQLEKMRKPRAQRIHLGLHPSTDQTHWVPALLVRGIYPKETAVVTDRHDHSL